jgi:hypothetical protein
MPIFIRELFHMDFWRLQSPIYQSDYDHTYVNGQLEHSFSMPGVRCAECGATWGGGRVVPHALPAELRARKELSEGFPIDDAAFRVLRAEVLDALHRQGASIKTLAPGDRFSPGILDVPTRPDVDFLWNSIGSVVVSERIQGALTQANVKGAAFMRVKPRKVGNRRAQLPAPVPASGEPEDLIDEIGATLPEEDVPPLYELIVTAESGPPPGTENASTCDSCGRASFNRAARQLVMLPAMWGGEDVFFIATTFWIIVAEPVRQLLGDLGATNVRWTAVRGAT